MKLRRLWLVVTLMGCAGTQRECASSRAEDFGADWVVVQVDVAGRPYRCWALRDTSIANERQSDGIYWRDPHGNLVHISNNYNRVQVLSDRWDEAYRTVGLTAEGCRALQARVFTGDAPRPTPALDPAETQRDLRVGP